MRNILFINSDEKVQERVRAILDEQDDYNLTIANTVEKAYEIIDSSPINFVLFDVDVAMEQGVNRLLEMKNRYPDLPIVATTPIHKGDPRDAEAPEKKEKQ